MTIARKYLIDYSETCFYHCMSRCIDQRFLLKKHSIGNQSNTYRQGWIEQRILFLGDVFAIDLLAYSIMDNHTHSVLHANTELAKQWSNTEVLRRWSKLGKIPILCQLYMSSGFRDKLSETELVLVLDKINEYRTKLNDISCFMSKLNSYIAHRANREDGRKGHFWEGRFKSQALLEVDAVYSCMAYVDLNPVRAGKAKCYTNCEYTSIKRRFDKTHKPERSYMVPIRFEPQDCKTLFLSSITLSDYIEHLESILTYRETSLFKANQFTEANTLDWLVGSIDFEDLFGIAAGPPELVAIFEQHVREAIKRQASSSDLNRCFLFQ